MGEWRKSSYSDGNGGQCIEVASAEGIAVRDTTDRDGGTLVFSAQAWKAFAVRIKHSKAA